MMDVTDPTLEAILKDPENRKVFLKVVHGEYLPGKGELTYNPQSGKLTWVPKSEEVVPA